MNVAYTRIRGRRTYIHLTIFPHARIKQVRDGHGMPFIGQASLSKQEHRRVRTPSSLIIHVYP